jgi:hypothetical protein
MEFNNLDCNILYLLKKDFNSHNRKRPFDTRRIYEAFADIPKEGVDDAITSLERDELIILVNGKQKVLLTADGISRVESFEYCSP